MRPLFSKLQQFINARENPVVTQYLIQSPWFKNFVHKTEFTKVKMMQKLDEAAFPEKYQGTLLEAKKSKTTKPKNK